MKSETLPKHRPHDLVAPARDPDEGPVPQCPAGNSADLEILIHKVITQDEAALLALYDRVSTPLYSLAFTMLEKEEHACEVLQETFAWIWVNGHKFRRHKGSAFSWLVDLVRKRALIRVRSEGPNNALVEYCATVLQGTETDSEGHHGMWNSKTRHAFKSLTEEEQKVLKLAFFGGFNLLEIAEKIGAPPESIRRYAFQGMARLHDAIKNSTHL